LVATVGGLIMSKVLDFYEFGLGKHDFYRCVKCNGIFTYEQERIRISRMPERGDMMIHCTSKKYQPTVPSWWEWARPSVLKYTVKLVLARGLYPILKKHGMRRTMRLIERLVSNRLTR
jgi:hypothetical protein